MKDPQNASVPIGMVWNNDSSSNGEDCTQSITLYGPCPGAAGTGGDTRFCDAPAGDPTPKSTPGLFPLPFPGAGTT
ncbi:hypothetical protein Hypma_001120 [Hypsizygus marmoreus]|uniref:Uncharacterized protein n=1 Tax=Hypsizygus marmoreus TaxID=39966 RepID=A0A369JFF3_HYPMA|nr:hypothetical protein Hypma_001120 [Hypsizygus marmoreus]